VVNALKQFDIPFVGLKEGVHHFHYDIAQSFFKHFIDQEFEKGNFQADLRFDKQQHHFKLSFEISGMMRVPCDRCNEEFDLEIDGDYEVYVKFTDHSEKLGGVEEENEDLIYISPSDNLINVAQLIFEYIELSVPMKKVHPGNGCNPEVLKLLNEYIIKEEKKPDHDPRWDKLKDLE